MICKERVVQTFLDLCSIDSPSFNERKVADYITAYCKRLGFEVTEDNAGDKVGGNCGNLIVKLPGRGEGFFRVFLSAHMDTVESTEGIQIVREGGVIKTDGRTILGADDKVGIAVILEAVHSLVDADEDYASGLLIFTIAEEKGLLGASAIELDEVKEIDFGFVFDTGPEVGSVVMRTPFHYEFKVVVKGLSAHAGREPEKGLSAIQLACRALADAPQGRVDEETTCNYGSIQGGGMNNVVCSEVEVKGEVRSFSEDKGKELLREIEENFKKSIDCLGGKYEFYVDLHGRPYFHDKGDEIIQYVYDSWNKLSLVPNLKFSLGSSDANIWNSRGVPCVNIGVGMQSIHTFQEYCYEEDMCVAASVARSILQTDKRALSKTNCIKL